MPEQTDALSALPGAWRSGRRRPRASNPTKIGLLLFATGLLGVVVIMVLFATGSHDLPLWLNLAAMLAPVGFGVGLVGVFLEGRSRVVSARRRALPETADTGARPETFDDWDHRMTGTTAAGVVQVAQHADDLDRATAFYTGTLGLPLIARFGPLVFVDLGGTRLLLEQAAPPSMIYLRVDDLHGRIVALRAAGVDIVAEPHDIFTDTDGVFGGEWRVEAQAFIRDSEGNLVGLVAHRS